LKVCITGGSGFIGSRLATALRGAGHDVRIIDLVQSPSHAACVTVGDVRDLVAVLAVTRNCDVVVHLAAEHRDDVRPIERYFDVNVGGARSLVAAMSANGVQRCLLVSSVAVYGLNQKEPDESSPLSRQLVWRQQGTVGDGVFRLAVCCQRAILVVLRPVVVFGEGNRGNVHTLIEQIRRKRFLMIGRGDNRKSVACVDNLVAFAMTQIESAPGIHRYNYADKPDRPVRELVAVIDRALGRPTRHRWYLPRWLGLLAGHAFDLAARLRGRPFSISAARVRKFCADTCVSTRAVDASGFQRTVTIDQGLQRMVLGVLRTTDAADAADAAVPAATGVTRGPVAPERD
jgi:nucleoside-diphosphate-sugar epimerase